MLATSTVFTNTTQGKQSSNKRKFAQSGHPGFKPMERVPQS
jgi:hypothetical protein